MRAFVDSILSFIGSWSLTDEEYESISADLDGVSYSVENYNVIKELLESREGVSTYVARLTSYFTAKGIDVGDGSNTPKSEIFIGDEL